MSHTVHTLTDIKSLLHTGIVNANAAITTSAFNRPNDTLIDELEALAKTINDAAVLNAGLLHKARMEHSLKNFSSNKLKKRTITPILAA